MIFFFAFPYLNQSQINGVAWMGLNFYDNHDFSVTVISRKIMGGYKIMRHTAH